MEKVNYDVRDQFNQPLLNRAKLIEIIKEEREARERAEKALQRLLDAIAGDNDDELHLATREAEASLKSSDGAK